MKFYDKDYIIEALQRDIKELTQRLEKIQYISATIIFGMLLVLVDLFWEKL